MLLYLTLVKEMVANNIKETISKHKQIIIVAVAVAAIASYLIPFDQMIGAVRQDRSPQGYKD